MPTLKKVAWPAPRVILVNGLISDAAGMAGEKARAEGWFDVSTFKEPYRAEGKKITVTLNGKVINQADLGIITDPAVLKKHPGALRTAGHIGLLGHDSKVEFRNLRVRSLP